MNLSRRTVLDLAAASAPFAVPPTDAAALLSEPAAIDPGPGRQRIGTPNGQSPVQFAESIDGEDWSFRDGLAHGSPADMARYKQAYDALLDAVPPALDGDEAIERALQDLDESALALWSAAWMAGVRAGAAYEHLRLALIVPATVCEGCHGHGRTWNGRPFRKAGRASEMCAACGGRGTVPTPPARLAIG